MKSTKDRLNDITREQLALFVESMPEHNIRIDRLIAKLPASLMEGISSMYGRKRRFEYFIEEWIQVGPIDGWYPYAQTRAGGGYRRTRDINEFINWGASKKKRIQGHTRIMRMIFATAKREQRAAL